MNLINKLFNRNELVLISTLIVQAAEEYQKNALVTVSNNIDDISREVISEMTCLKSEMNRLQDIGLGNSKNFKLLKQRYNILDESVREVNKQILNRRKSEHLVEYIKLLKKLNPNSFLISEEQFKNICKKYNLRTEFLTNYTGTIPEKNIQDLSKVKYYNLDFNKNIYYVTTVYGATSKSTQFVIEEDFDKNGRFIDIHSKYDLVKKLRVEYSCPSLDISTIFVNYDSFLIACPKDQLKKQKLIFSSKSIDPIVFQYCPYGIVVHTIWGEEAEDKSIKHYQEMNNLIQKL